MITQEQFDNICAAAPEPKNNPASTGGWNVNVERLQELLELIPNKASIDREGEESWINIGHYAKGLCPEGREVFIAWTLTWQGEPKNPDSFTPEAIGHSWDGFGNSGLLSQGGRLRAMAERINPAGFRQWDARQVFDDGIALAVITPGPGPGPGQVQFALGERGEILKTMENAGRGLCGLGITCAYDQFHHRVIIQQGGEGASRKLYVGRLTDNAVLMLRVELNTVYGRDFGPGHIGDAVMALALLNSFNPVTDMLATAEALWDGVRRLDRLGPDYFHTRDTELARVCFRKTMLAAVRRARRPGCKFDQILVTESPEGWNKSSAWEVLAGAGNFSDASILGKDARAVQEELADIWIHESADLSGLTKAEVEHVKAFASRTNDRARPAYGRYLIDQPRQSIEAGTTNAEMYLPSQTGNRRFWPFKLLQRINLEKLKSDRLQLWGEAAAAESAGETLVLPERLWATAGEEQEKRRVVDSWEVELMNLEEIPSGSSAPAGGMRIQIRDGEQFITVLSIQEYLGGYRGQHFNSGSGRKIADIMRKLEWERVSVKIDGKSAWGYKRKRSTICDPSAPSSVTENLF